MKINTLLTVILSSSMFFAACGNQSEVEDATEGTEESVDAPDETDMHEKSYTISPAESALNFSAEMLGMYTHTGTVNFVNGVLSMIDGKVLGGSFAVDMNSIDFNDENFSEDNPEENLTSHLKSDAFFDVPQFPQATLNINQVDGSSALCVLIIRGVDKAVNVTDIAVTEEGANYIVTAKLTINRKDFGASWTHPVKEMVISDDINLDVRLVLPQN